MAAVKSAWAIDVGNNSLKALRLRASGENIEVIGLDYIEYPKVLAAENITEDEKSQIIRSALNTFVSRNNISSKEPIAVSVPGQSSFARFIKLPPVDPKRVPEIIKFEAVQQIPFDINEVEWDWQLMLKKDSPDIEVGIFAIKNEIVSKFLENFSAENIRVSIVQMVPMALYNYAHFDRKDLDDADRNAVVLLDMGVDNTNLVICTKSNVWQRCIPLGGNNFTKAVASAFKLDFEKAEKLKRSAPVSKYARQILHSMTPVFTDIGTEVQRSLGYYSSNHKNTSFTKIILLGGGFKLQGLNKYIQQTTQIPTFRPDAFEKLTASQGISTAKLHENICDFAVAYGLGLQALNIAKIQSNLLPTRIARSMMWAQKSKMFIAAAVVLLAVSALSLFRTFLDLKAVSDKNVQNRIAQAQAVLQSAQEASRQLEAEKQRGLEYQTVIENHLNLFKHRDVIPMLYDVILKTLPNAQNNPQQAELYEAYARGDVERIKRIPRNQRKQAFITSISVEYTDSLANTSLEGGRQRTIKSESTITAFPASSEQQDFKGFIVIIEGYSPYEKIGDIMDPIGTGDDQSKWGIITRLAKLDKVIDGNCPFELFQKDRIEHFKFETGAVDLQDRQMPAGIGIKQTVTRVSSEDSASGTISSRTRPGTDLIAKEEVLIDPLTKEEMSKTFDLDDKGRKKLDSFGQPIYIERDKWFRIKAKFIWKTADQQTTTQDQMQPPVMM